MSGLELLAAPALLDATGTAIAGTAAAGGAATGAAGAAAGAGTGLGTLALTSALTGGAALAANALAPGLDLPKTEATRMPDPEDPRYLESRRAEIRKQRARRGRGSTILTGDGSGGDYGGDSAPTYTNTLLGQ